MNRILRFTLPAFVACAALLSSCTTKDVPGGSGPDPHNLYQITDAALGDYLIYNCQRTDQYRLPYGTAIQKDGLYYIDKSIAATARILYLVKDATRMDNLNAAGVPTAYVKIANVDGIQFFTGLTSLRLTSNAVTGELDLSPLVKLDTLEMNNNYVNKLTVPASITRLRYGASAAADAPDNRWITRIDLSACSNLAHLYLTNQHIADAASFILPLSYTHLKEVDMTANPGAPFTVPTDLYNQCTIRNGIEPADASWTGPLPKSNYFKVPDLAFAEYLVYLVEKETDVTKQLPAGTALKYTDGNIYINISVAANATVLNVAKTTALISTLQAASVATASQLIADADGLQYFTGIKQFTATSNQFTATLKLGTLTNLETLQVATASVGSLDLSHNTKLKVLSCAGSAKSGYSTLVAIDLSKNIALTTVDLKNNKIPLAGATGLDNLVSLTSIDMSGTGMGVNFPIAAVIYTQLTTKVNVVSK